MKRLVVILGLLLAGNAFGQLTVQWNFSDFTGKPQRLRKVIIRPLAQYGVMGTNIVTTDRITLITDLQGRLVVRKMPPGEYMVRLYGTTGLTTFTNYFPRSLAGVVDASDYMGAGVRPSGDDIAYSAAASDVRFMTNALPDFAGGAVLTLLDTNGDYAWLPGPAGSGFIQNNQDGLMLGGTFSGGFFGNGGGLTNVLNLSIVTNYSAVSFTNYTQFVLSGFGDSSANGVYSFAGLAGGKVCFSNGQYLLVSNLMTAGMRWGVTNNGAVYYISPRQDASGYPGAGSWLAISGPSPPGRMDLVTGATNGDGFPQVSSAVPVLTADGNTVARVETFGSDVTGRIGFTPVMPFASLDGVTRYLTNNPQSTNNGVILLGPGTFPISKIPPLAGQAVVGSGRGASLVGVPQVMTNLTTSTYYAFYLQNNNPLIENVGFLNPIQVLGAVSNAAFIDVDIGLSNPSNLIDSIFTVSGGLWGLTARRCHFASSWDATQGVMTGTFYDCRLDAVPGWVDANFLGSGAGVGQHPYTLDDDRQFFIIHGGEVNIVDGPVCVTNGVVANACVWVPSAKANVRLFGPSLNHHSTNTPDCAIFNPLGNTNIVGWYFDNGVLTFVNGTNSWTNAPPPDWPPARLFDHY